MRVNIVSTGNLSAQKLYSINLAQNFCVVLKAAAAATKKKKSLEKFIAFFRDVMWRVKSSIGLTH